MILQEFDLEFEHAKSKKSLVFIELICDLPSTETENVARGSLPDESFFLISFDDLWYGDIIIYLHTLTFWPDLSSTYRRRIQYVFSHDHGDYEKPEVNTINSFEGDMKFQGF